MKKYIVAFTATYEVDAPSESRAEQKAQHELVDKYPELEDIEVVNADELI